MQNKKELAFPIVVFIVLCLIGFFVMSSDLKGTKQTLANAKPGFIAVALAFVAVSYSFASLAFAKCVRLFSAKRVPFSDQLRIGFITTAVNNLASIGGVAGHSLRAILLKAYSVRPSKSIAISFFYTCFYNLVFLCLFPISIVYLVMNNVLRLNALQVAGLILLFVLFLFYSTGLVFISKMRRWTLRIAQKLLLVVLKKDFALPFRQFDSEMDYGAKISRNHISGIVVLVAFVSLDWLASVFTMGFCFLAVGAALNPGTLLAGFIVGLTLGAISMIPGGLGIQDGSMVGIYHILGVALQQAILAVIMFRIVFYFLPYFISLISYLRLSKNGFSGKVS